MPTSSNNSRRKTIAVAPTGENGPINRASPSVRFDADVATKRRESLPALAISNNHHTNNNNKKSAATPGKKPSIQNITGGDFVLEYHFKDVLTPYSTKKRKTTGLKVRENDKNQQHPGEVKRSRTEEVTANSNALNDTFNMGGNTADINSVLYATSAGYDVNESMMSMESKSSAASSTASSGMDALNLTTLSDTHEYTASSFIQAAKFRNVLDERAKSLFAEAKKKKKEEAEATQTLVLEDLTLSGLELTQNATQTSLGGVLSEEPSATLELEDLTLNLGGDLTQSATQNHGGHFSGMKQRENFAKSSIREEKEDEIGYIDPSSLRTTTLSEAGEKTSGTGGKFGAILSQTMDEGDDDVDEHNNNEREISSSSFRSNISPKKLSTNNSLFQENISPIKAEPSTSIKDTDLNYLLTWDPTKRGCSGVVVSRKKTNNKVTIAEEEDSRGDGSGEDGDAKQPMTKITRNDLGYMLNWNPFAYRQKKEDDSVGRSISLSSTSRSISNSGGSSIGKTDVSHVND